MDATKETRRMSQQDLLFCYRLARITHAKKLSASSRQKIELLLRTTRVGVTCQASRRRS